MGSTTTLEIVTDKHVFHWIIEIHNRCHPLRYTLCISLHSLDPPPQVLISNQNRLPAQSTSLSLLHRTVGDNRPLGSQSAVADDVSNIDVKLHDIFAGILNMVKVQYIEESVMRNSLHPCNVTDVGHSNFHIKKVLAGMLDGLKVEDIVGGI